MHSVCESNAQARNYHLDLRRYYRPRGNEGFKIGQYVIETKSKPFNCPRVSLREERYICDRIKSINIYLLKFLNSIINFSDKKNEKNLNSSYKLYYGISWNWTFRAKRSNFSSRQWFIPYAYSIPLFTLFRRK